MVAKSELQKMDGPKLLHLEKKDHYFSRVHLLSFMVHSRSALGRTQPVPFFPFLSKNIMFCCMLETYITLL